MNGRGFDDRLLALAARAEKSVQGQFEHIDSVAFSNAAKVLSAFQKHRVSDSDFNGTDGYGYDDSGREKLDCLYADVFHADSALVRLQFVNGTQAIFTALASLLHPGEKVLYAVGEPYDTLQTALGLTGNAPGNLRSFNIGCTCIPAQKDGGADLNAILEALSDKSVHVVMIQRSRGYSDRRSLSVREIGEICVAVKSVRPDILIVADNCYGEFTEVAEPTDAGVDLAMGSLIKNPGGGLAPTGGYIVGRRDLTDACAMRLTAPGLGREVGATLGHNKSLYQGLFLAPTATAAALKTAVFAAALLEELGYKTNPSSRDTRFDIVQSIAFGNPELLRKFCRGIQAGSPINAYVSPEEADMPGYDSQVIMAAGTFVQGASVELSCDGPMREPYIAYLQGGLTYEMGKLGVMTAVQYLTESENGSKR